MTSWSSNIKIWFLQAYRIHYSKKLSWCAKICAIGETELIKLEVFILGGQRIDQKRKKGWLRGEQREERKQTKGTELAI